MIIIIIKQSLASDIALVSKGNYIAEISPIDQIVAVHVTYTPWAFIRLRSMHSVKVECSGTGII